MERFYKRAGISRQAFHQRKRQVIKEEAQMQVICSLVRDYRATKDARAGSRTLYYNLDIKHRFDLGVNKFERLMAKYNLTLRPLRSKVITTRSCYQSWQYENKTNGLVLTDINQLVVGDITYLDIWAEQYYAFSLMDIYSMRVVGLTISTRMRTIEALKCFGQWEILRERKNLFGCIHHTDGGTQYFSKAYLDRCVDAFIITSRANSCMENGYIEQWHSVLKHHLLPTIASYKTPSKEKIAEQIVQRYNAERKQENLGWLSPVEFERKWNNNIDRPQKVLYDFTI